MDNKSPAALRRRQQQFVAEVHQCDALIYSICRLYGCRREQSTEDLYQEIVCALWESYDTFHGQSSFSSWLYAVARNTAVAYYRRNHLYQPDLSLTDLECDFPDWHDSPNPLVGELYYLLDQLKADDRHLIGLYIEGYDYAEIAQKMHLNEPAVRTRMSRIKSKLKEIKDKQK
ncbi:MAG: RNA polymerase sigma factor [Bacteroidales bacterium]|nr:RNA polymerase sigma factor [Bacteroidales bacterium]